MNCPRCTNTTLVTEIIHEHNQDIEIDICKTCHGIWFDEGELDLVENISEPVMMEIRKIPSAWDQLTALYCPSCESHPLMKKAEHPRDRKVIYDCCSACKGIWLDGGELAAIQRESWFTTIIKLFKKIG